MGRKSRQKKQKKLNIPTPVRSPMDPALMEAFSRGRDAGFATGKIEGLAEMMQRFDLWVEEIDSHVKGIGPKTKRELQIYFAKRIQDAIENKKIHNGEIEILNNNMHRD